MNEGNIGYYILQYATIIITLVLGFVNYYQNQKIQKGQNIISVTTNYRMKRCEQLKECGHKLISNSSVVLLKMNKDNYNLLYNINDASDNISLIMHRYFEYDRELIELAADIASLASLFSDDLGNKKLELELEYKRRVFVIKCDIYTTADWNRIKSETDGKNSSADDWYMYYKKFEVSYLDEINKLKFDYENAISKL